MKSLIAIQHIFVEIQLKKEIVKSVFWVRHATVDDLRILQSDWEKGTTGLTKPKKVVSDPSSC